MIISWFVKVISVAVRTMRREIIFVKSFSCLILRKMIISVVFYGNSICSDDENTMKVFPWVIHENNVFFVLESTEQVFFLHGNNNNSSSGMSLGDIFFFSLKDGFQLKFTSGENNMHSAYNLFSSLLLWSHLNKNAPRLNTPWQGRSLNRITRMYRLIKFKLIWLLVI
jgi:hypothetical protein